MPTDPTNGRSPDLARLRNLFEQAFDLPPHERERFVRHAAGDDMTLAEQVLGMFEHADAPSDRLRQQLDTPHSEPDDEGHPGHDQHVQPTATDELLRQLASAPRLDERRFVIESRIGSGGMGAVHRVHDQHLNRRLAIKFVLDKHKSDHLADQSHANEVLGRFLEEAQVTSQLDHPGVIPVHELGLDRHGDVFFMMRMVQGRTASKVFADAHAARDEWTLTRALEVVLKVCDTMSYAHEKGVLHRDLKPINVMVGRFGEVYVMDWGLAKVTGQVDRHDERLRAAAAGSAAAPAQDAEDPGAAGRTRQGSSLGTPSYMSPEQARGEFATLDVRTDVYAVGAMLYELVTGFAPYTSPGENAGGRALRERVLAGPPASIESLQARVPAELVAIVGKAMARDREQRYADMAALAGDVRAFLDQRAVNAYRTGALVELRLWVRRNKELAASLAAAALILVAGIVVSLSLARQKDALAAERTQFADQERTAKERFASKVREFDQLAGKVLYERAIANEATLWPPWPSQVAAMERWLRENCGRLLAMQPDIEQTIADLRARALPATAEDQEADRRSHPRFAEWERKQVEVAAMRRAQDVRTGRRPWVEPELPEELRRWTAIEWKEIAWRLVDPQNPGRERGRERLALACARQAVAAATTNQDRATFGYPLAWALFWCGRDDEALAVAERNVELAAESSALQRLCERSLAALRDQITAVRGDQGEQLLANDERALAAIEGELNLRRTWHFGASEEDQAARFLHDTLVELSDKLRGLEATEKVAVEQRLGWARQIGELTRAHPKARHTWDAVRAAIARNPKYAGQRILLREDDDGNVLGLVPIDENPTTGLWEFYDLRSAWDGKSDPTAISIPKHQPNGKIDVLPDTGIVFVLLPGGTFTMGAQARDSNRTDYDPDAMETEAPPHLVTLTPFLIARHELTRGQWERLVGTSPFLWEEGREYEFDPIAISPTHPADSIDWIDANRWMENHGMCLPTEAQWEYGCRGDSSGSFWPGNELKDLELVANIHDQTSAAQKAQWGKPAPFADGFTAISPAGHFLANSLGLHDVHGNVLEWCRDAWVFYGDYPARAGDGYRQCRDSNTYRMVRGGSHQTMTHLARTTARIAVATTSRIDHIGLRPARMLLH